MTGSFANQTIEAARRALATKLQSAANDSAELDARLLVGHALSLVDRATHDVTPGGVGQCAEHAVEVGRRDLH